jgi:hypothetical protein
MRAFGKRRERFGVFAVANQSGETAPRRIDPANRKFEGEISLRPWRSLLQS